MKKTIKIKSNNNQTLKFKMLQFPLMPDVAITSHKHQGATATNGIIIGSNSSK